MDAPQQLFLRSLFWFPHIYTIFVTLMNKRAILLSLFWSRAGHSLRQLFWFSAAVPERLILPQIANKDMSRNTAVMFLQSSNRLNTKYVWFLNFSETLTVFLSLVSAQAATTATTKQVSLHLCNASTAEKTKGFNKNSGNYVISKSLSFQCSPGQFVWSKVWL